MTDSIASYKYVMKSLKSSNRRPELEIALASSEDQLRAVRGHECSITLDPFGSQLSNQIGSDNNPVKLASPIDEMKKVRGNVYTHNHRYGTPLSLPDLNYIGMCNGREMRATNPEPDCYYSFEKPNTNYRNQFLPAYRECVAQAYKDHVEEIRQDYQQRGYKTNETVANIAHQVAMNLAVKLDGNYSWPEKQDLSLPAQK